MRTSSSILDGGSPFFQGRCLFATDLAVRTRAVQIPLAIRTVVNASCGLWVCPFWSWYTFWLVLKGGHKENPLFSGPQKRHTVCFFGLSFCIRFTLPQGGGSCIWLIGLATWSWAYPPLELNLQRPATDVKYCNAQIVATWVTCFLASFKLEQRALDFQNLRNICWICREDAEEWDARQALAAPHDTSAICKTRAV